MHLRAAQPPLAPLTRALLDLLRALRRSAELMLDESGAPTAVDEDDAAEPLASLAARLANFERVAARKAGYVAPPAGVAAAQRAALLERDATAVAETFGSDGRYAADGAALLAAIRTLRGVEQSAAFQRSLLRDRRRVSADTSYTMDNFAYGSTSFHSWRAIAALPPCAAAATARPGGGGSFVVLGSSTGLLALYGALYWGLPTRGVEILPSLVAVADAAAAVAAASVSPSSTIDISFEEGDVLQCDLSSATIIMATSQCWDVALIKALRAKLVKEVRPGACVIDYRPLLDGEPLFTSAVVATIPVSWDTSGIEVSVYTRT